MVKPAQAMFQLCRDTEGLAQGRRGESQFLPEPKPLGVPASRKFVLTDWWVEARTWGEKSR